MTNDVALNVPHDQELTVAQLRQFLNDADRIGLPDATIVICTAIYPTGRIGSLTTDIATTQAQVTE